MAQIVKSRYVELKKMLEERRRDIQGEVQEKLRDARTKGAENRNANVVRDAADVSVDDIQEDMEFALIQMKGETIRKINEALRRLEEGGYGFCFDCGGEISEQRLRALPFAVRCKECEEAREIAAEREREQVRRRRTLFAFGDNNP